MRSTPSQHFGLERRGVAQGRVQRDRAQFAKTPSSWRSRSSPASGRTLASGSDHFGPPIAPSSTASARRQPASVAAGSGSPVASMAAPPNGAGFERELVAEAARDRLEHAHAFGVTSGPMPSPARTAIVRLHRRALLEGARCRGMRSQQEAELVDAVQAGSSARTARAESSTAAPVGQRQRGAREVDGRPRRPGCSSSHCMRRLVDHDRQQAVLERSCCGRCRRSRC